jgi:hypothetical protein
MSRAINILARSLPTSLRRRGAISLLLLAAAVVCSPGLARADGDPASDVLVSQNAFVPWDASLKPGEQARLEAVLTAAGRAGYPIRVALIASASDLGSVTALWREPQNYAHFLWQELSFAVHAPVLVVMPGGFGLYTGRSPTAGEQAALARTRPAATGAGLAMVAVTAVQNLAAAAGHPLPAATLALVNSSGSGSGGTDTVSWIVFAAGAVLIAVAWGASVRAQPLRGRDRGVAS